MKIIYVKKVKANQEIEKSEGIYEDIREVFPDNETQREMIKEFQHQEEIEESQKDSYEQSLAEKYYSNPEDYKIVDLESPEGLEEGTMSTIMSHMNSGEDMIIDYITDSGFDITRTVQPLQIFTAGTGNQILLTRTREWDDYRAYIINNIQSIESADQTEYYL
jgi:hypothetical protein